MQQALNEQAKIDQKLVFDYRLNSQTNVKVVQILEKNECGFYNIRVKLTEDNKLGHQDDELVQDKMTDKRSYRFHGNLTDEKSPFR